MQDVRIHLGAVLTALALPVAALAHDDDPKVLDRRAPFQGEGIRTGTPIPGGQQNASGGGFPANNVTLLSWVTLDDFGGFSAASDCWGYTSPSGREYAIICLSSATGFVDITQPNNPQILATPSAPSSTWRDVKTYNEHAYVVSEGGSGIQVYNLSNIDSGVVQFLGNVTTGGTTSSHNVAIDTDSGYLYRCGGGNNIGLRIYDLNANPANPPFVGQWNTKYVHDAQIVTFTSGPNAGKQIAFCNSGFNNGGSNTGLSILDVTNKGSIQTIREVFWPGAGYSHQGWLTEDGEYFLVNDELDEPPKSTTTYVIDVNPLGSAFLADTYTNGNAAIGHNGYVAGDLLYEANYTSGLRVMDVSDPLNISEVGYFDTFPDNDQSSFNGLWSCYPLFPSGIVIGSDTERGLFVMWPGDPLISLSFQNGAPPFIDPNGSNEAVTVIENSAGALVPGTEMLHYDDGSGYQSIPLISQGGTNYTAPFPAADCGSSVRFYISAESTNGLVWSDPPGGETEAYGAVYGLGLTTVLADNFENNNGWSVQNGGASTGDWDRGVPVNDPNWDYDPASDSDGSGSCYLTENANGNTDVDGGATTLLSPVLDMSSGSGQFSYDYFLRMTDSDSTDRILVQINTNGGSGSWTTVADHNSDNGLDWTPHIITQADLDSAGVTLTAQTVLRFVINDSNPQSITEGGIDRFLAQTVDCDFKCPTPVVYCTPKSGLICGVPLIDFSGTSSAAMSSGFEIFTGPARGIKGGVLLYGLAGEAAIPFQGGTLCVNPAPLRRATPVSSGGTLNQCDGEFRIDMNAFASGALGGNPDSALTQVGTIVNVQWWGRDSVQTGSYLSNAIEYTVCP